MVTRRLVVREDKLGAVKLVTDRGAAVVHAAPAQAHRARRRSASLTRAPAGDPVGYTFLTKRRRRSPATSHRR